MGPLIAKSSTRGTGGAERQCYLFGQELKKRGWRVSFVADFEAHGAQQVSADRDAIHVPFAFLKGKRWRLPQDALLLFMALRRANPRYIVLKTAHVLLLPILLYAKLHRRQLIFWGQTSTDFDLKKGNEGRWLRWIRHLGIRQAACVAVQTGDQLKALKTHFGRQGAHIPNITTVRAAGGSACERDEKCIFWCGNASANKRPLVFVELARQIPERRFVMAMNPADGQLYERVRGLCGELPNMRFLGSVPAENISRWFAQASLLVNTSAREGFPNTFLEAWEQGVAVASLCVNPDGVLNDPVLGACTFADDAHLRETDARLAVHLARTVRMLLQAVPGDKSAAEARRRHVLRNHSPGVVVGRLLAALEDRSQP